MTQWAGMAGGDATQILEHTPCPFCDETLEFWQREGQGSPADLRWVAHCRNKCGNQGRVGITAEICCVTLHGELT